MKLPYKQKTAYEMCVGDWSSDVCSSDLLVKNLLAMQETQVRFLGWEDPLEKETADRKSVV